MTSMFRGGAFIIPSSFSFFSSPSLVNKRIYGACPTPSESGFLTRKCHRTGFDSASKWKMSSLLGKEEKWLTDNAGKSQLMTTKPAQVGDVSDTCVQYPLRNGLYMKTQCKSGDEILSIPLKTMITLDKASSFFGNSIKDQDNYSLMALYLIHEKNIGDKSEYYPLIDSFPQDLSCLHQPFLWSDDELNYIEGSDVKIKALMIKENILKEYSDLKERFFSSSSPLFKSEWFTLENFLWAQAIILSRSVSFPSELPLVIVPILPSANNSLQDGTASLELSRVGLFREYRARLIAGNNYKKGDQVFYKYGSEFQKSDPVLSTADLLLDYGIVMECNDNKPGVEMQFEVAKIDPFFDDKIDILELQGLQDTLKFTVKQQKKTTAPVSKDMIQFLRLVCLIAQDAFLLEAVFRRDVWGFMELPVSESNEEAVLNLIQASCEEALEKFEGNSLLKEEAPTKNENNIRRYIAHFTITNEKKALEDCIKWCARELGTLDSKEYYQERRLKELDLLRPIDESEIVDSETGARASRAFDEFI